MFRLNPTVLTLLIISFVASSVPAHSQGAYRAQVGTPRFTIKGAKPLTIGKCFAVQWFRQRNFLIMPLHLLGSAGPGRSAISQSQVNSSVSKVEVLDLSGRRVVEVAKRSVLRANLPASHMGDNEPGDVMAFELPARSHLPVLGFSGALPSTAERVNILTYEFNERSTSHWKCRGSVQTSNSQYLVIKLDQPLAALSSDGAPIVNERNQLIGMLIGPQNANRTIVTAIPATGIYSRLLTEVGR